MLTTVVLFASYAELFELWAKSDGTVHNELRPLREGIRFVLGEVRVTSPNCGIVPISLVYVMEAVCEAKRRTRRRRLCRARKTNRSGCALLGMGSAFVK